MENLETTEQIMSNVQMGVASVRREESSFISGVKAFGTTSHVYISSEDEEIPDHMRKVKSIEEVVEMAKEVFDSKNIHIAKNRIYIRFPEIEIKNSLGATHKIYDLIVKMTVNFSSGSCTRPTFEGLRTGLTVNEVKNNYSHSHLESGTFGRFTPFCLGSSDFALIVQNIGVNSTITNWKILLLSIESFVSWESLEGGPHIKIQNLSQTNPAINDALIKGDIPQMISKIPLNCIDFDIYKIIEGYNFDNFVNENARVRTSRAARYTDEDRKNCLSKITELGRKIIWNDDYLEFKIIKEEETVVEEPTTVDSNIKGRYLIYLSAELNEFSKNYKYEYNKKKHPRSHYTLGKTKADNIRSLAGADSLLARQA